VEELFILFFPGEGRTEHVQGSVVTGFGRG